MTSPGARLAIWIVFALPIVWLPVQYGIPLSPMTILAGVVWIGTLALVLLTAWPRSRR